ncbi:MAG: hypothetical protein E7555_03915 [Ruminococcaceae bacterium]|nr:hypothetical protein [Oscillospiraceae bacterium]
MKISDNNRIEKEARKKWGETNAYKEYCGKSKGYTEEKYAFLAEGMNDIFAEFAVCMKNDEKPDSENTQNLVKKLQGYITENYYTCTKEILSGLGQMYVLDERFKHNIDKQDAGTAEFVSNAIKFYCR